MWPTATGLSTEPLTDARRTRFAGVPAVATGFAVNGALADVFDASERAVTIFVQRP
jgi:hypothetical protein